MIFELLLLAAGAIPLPSLVPFAGTVIDDEGAPLAGVIVAIDGQELPASDRDGRFGPTKLTPGRHRLVASFGDFRSYALDLAVDARRPEMHYRLELDLSLIRGHREWVPLLLDAELPSGFKAAPESVAGCWATRAREGATLKLRQRPDGDYDATYHSGGCLAHWELHRRARLSRGTLLFNYPLRRYPAATFQHLYVTESDGKQYLVESTQVPEFLKQLTARPPYGIRWYSSYLLEKGACRD